MNEVVWTFQRICFDILGYGTLRTYASYAYECIERYDDGILSKQEEMGSYLNRARTFTS